jgi:hypothetical protein
MPRSDGNDARPDQRGISSGARRFELKPLTAVALIAAGATGLALFAGLVMGGHTRAFDEWLLLWLREGGDPQNPIGPAWFEEMVRDVSALGSTFVLTFAVAVVAVYLLIVKAPQKAAFLVAACAAGALMNWLLKLAFGRERPDIVPHVTHATGESFPSGHTTNSAIIYLMLGMDAGARRGQLHDEGLHIHGLRAPDRAGRAEPHLPRRPLADRRHRRLGSRRHLGTARLVCADQDPAQRHPAIGVTSLSSVARACGH